MNELLRISFKKMGYDYDHLTDISKSRYGPGYLFKGETELCLALKDIRARKDRIVVLPDFDMDGISAGAVLFSGLSLLGFRVSLYQPVPNNGYGFKQDDIDTIMRRWPDVKAILTCDVGIAADFAISYAMSYGIRVLVTDHHVEKPGKRVDAEAVMDPCRYDETAEFTGVCGAWVAWHLITTFASLSGNSLQQELCRKLVLFVGLGSCGDLMPMIHDTRQAVLASTAEFSKLMAADDLSAYFGCDAAALPEAYSAPFDNMKAFHAFLAGFGKADDKAVTDEDYSFLYCPMFNSVRRMGQQMDNVYAMLYQRHVWNSLDRLTLFRWLYDLNDARKKTVAALYAQLENDSRQALAPYIYLVDAVPGVLGLLAAKLMDRFGRPCLVLRPEPAKHGYSGSGRVPHWMDKGAMLDVKGVTHDGHDRAFGVFVPESSLMGVWNSMDARYVSEFNRHTAERGSVPDKRTTVCIGGHAACGDYDFSVTSVDDFDTCMDYAMEVRKFRPFGTDFPEPSFVLKFLKSDIIGSRKMGSDNTHARLSFDTNFQAVWFGGAHFLDEIESDGPGTAYALEGKFGVNTFNGSTSLQFMISGRA